MTPPSKKINDCGDLPAFCLASNLGSQGLFPISDLVSSATDLPFIPEILRESVLVSPRVSPLLVHIETDNELYTDCAVKV